MSLNGSGRQRDTCTASFCSVFRRQGQPAALSPLRPHLNVFIVSLAEDMVIFFSEKKENAELHRSVFLQNFPFLGILVWTVRQENGRRLLSKYWTEKGLLLSSSPTQSSLLFLCRFVQFLQRRADVYLCTFFPVSSWCLIAVGSYLVTVFPVRGLGQALCLHPLPPPHPHWVGSLGPAIGWFLPPIESSRPQLSLLLPSTLAHTFYVSRIC